MLPWPQNFTLEQATETWLWPLYPLERNLIPTADEIGWAPEPFWSGAENLVPTTGFNP